jgi:hypothetical protein
MPHWGEILAEINTAIKGGNLSAFDVTRRKYIADLQAYTKRETIVYASRWVTGDVPPNLISINDEDMQGFMEVIHGLKTRNLDLILHTGGGSAESVDAIVSYLRQKFDDIRIIIPHAAMSAGTMFACAANKIVMGKHSFIGPIDPQLILQTSVGLQSVPAHSIIEQFEKAKGEIAKNPQALNYWMPMLNQYGPALIVQCHNLINFGRELVENWLGTYMLSSDKDKAKSIALYLSDHSNFKTHNKHININKAIELGLQVEKLEDDQIFQEKVLSVYHAITFSLNSAAKIITNHNGSAFVKQLPKAPRPPQNP